MHYILVFPVMLNGIIIINWISNGLLLVVQVDAADKSKISARDQPTERHIGIRGPPEQITEPRVCGINERALVHTDTCNLGIIVSILAFVLVWNLLLNCSTSYSHLSKLFDDVFLPLLLSRQRKWSSALEATRKMNILFQASTHFALFSSHTLVSMHCTHTQSFGNDDEQSH